MRPLSWVENPAAALMDALAALLALALVILSGYAVLFPEHFN